MLTDLHSLRGDLLDGLRSCASLIHCEISLRLPVPHIRCTDVVLLHEGLIDLAPRDLDSLGCLQCENDGFEVVVGVGYLLSGLSGLTIIELGLLECCEFGEGGVTSAPNTCLRFVEFEDEGFFDCWDHLGLITHSQLLYFIAF